MNDTPDIPTINRNIWIRGLFMLLMALAFQVSATVVCFVTVIQFLIVLLNSTPNARLILRRDSSPIQRLAGMKKQRSIGTSGSKRGMNGIEQ